MAINWNLYETRLNINGNTKRQRDLNNLQNNITNKLPNSLSCKTVKINGVDGSLNFTETEKGYDIQSLPNETFTVGDYVLYETLTYLVTDIHGDKEIYTSGSMELCKNTLKFQSPDGTILSYPCITSTNNAVGINSNPTMSLPNSLMTIKLPFDENTMTLREDRRLFVDRDTVKPRSYKITKVNNTEFNYGTKGLIEFTLEQTVSGEENDRPDLGICNYFDSIVDEPPVEGYSYATITCSNPNNEVILGSLIFRTLTPTWYDADGTISTEPITAVWSWAVPSGYEDEFTFEPSGNLLKVRVSENYDLLVTGKNKFTVNVMSSSGGYGGELELTIII